MGKPHLLARPPTGAENPELLRNGGAEKPSNPPSCPGVEVPAGHGNGARGYCCYKVSSDCLESMFLHFQWTLGTISRYSEDDFHPL